MVQRSSSPIYSKIGGGVTGPSIYLGLLISKYTGHSNAAVKPFFATNLLIQVSVKCKTLKWELRFGHLIEYSVPISLN